MNERIQKLAEQAELYAVSDNSSMLFDVWKKRYNEKFAELIVRECMDLVKDCYAEPGRSLYQTVCASTIIEEHFGVEE